MTPSPPSPDALERWPRQPRPQRLGVVGGLLLLVLLAHGLLLAGLPLGVGEPRPGDASMPISVRRIVLPSTLPPAAPVTAPEAPAVPRQRPVAARAAAPTPKAADNSADGSEFLVRTNEAGQPIGALSSPSPAVVAEAAAAASAPEPAASASVVVAEPAALAEGPLRTPAPTGGEVPVYATRMPAAATLQYDLKRGAVGGQGTLEWRPSAHGYELSIEGSVFGISVLSWRSQGAFDSAGIAPERFVDSRRGRDVRAANFQREARKITFSGPGVEYPLVGGAQDRLSWMLQLAAILEADPARRVTGEKVSMFVAGARGDGDVWTFTVLGVETLDLGGTPLPGTVALRRDPRKPFDTQVEVWLDPARQHLPARMRLTTLPGGDSTEFNLRP